MLAVAEDGAAPGFAAVHVGAPEAGVQRGARAGGWQEEAEYVGAQFGGEREQRRAECAGGEVEEEFEVAEELGLPVGVAVCGRRMGERFVGYARFSGHCLDEVFLGRLVLISSIFFFGRNALMLILGVLMVVRWE